MNIRWMAVLTGFVVDYMVTMLLFVMMNPEEAFSVAPVITEPHHLLLISLGILSTGIGGYVAGRMTETDHALHGLLVGVIGILFGQLSGSTLPRVLVVASAIGCIVGALGGLLSRYVPPARKVTR